MAGTIIDAVWLTQMYANVEDQVAPIGLLPKHKLPAYPTLQVVNQSSKKEPYMRALQTSTSSMKYRT